MSKLPPQFVYDKVREMRNNGMTDKEISEILKIRLSIIEAIQ
jgi:hypothetical protein